MRISDVSSDVCSSDLPQATLFGTAAAIGAISMISAKPEPGVSAELTGGYGNYNAYKVEGHVNAGNGVLAARVAGQWLKRDGYEIGRASCRERVCQYG